MRKFLVTMLCCICFCFSIFNPTISVLAEDIEKFSPIDAKEFVNEDISTVNITHNNELYSAEQTENINTIELSKDEKEFVYHLGETYLDENSIFVEANKNKIFNISLYNWYAIEYYGGKTYIADVITDIDRPEDIGIVGAFVYPAGSYFNAKNEMFDIDYATTHILEVLYVNNDISICNKIIAPIDDVLFTSVKEFSEDFELNKENADLLTEILIQSLSFEARFKSSMFDVMETQALTEDDVQIELSSLPNYGTYANSNKTVRLNAYDKYTDYDKYIDEYEEIYKNKVHTFYGFGLNISVSDDPIINIIPKQLFVARGTYSYIGKEYGFYVKTVQDYYDDNYSDFIVFDIETVQPYPGRTNGMLPPSVTIRPLFSGTIRYVTSWGNIVVYDGYSDPNLALANIQVAGALNNINESNIGDADYVASKDYGYAFSSYAFEAVGTGLKRDTDKIDLGWVKTTFGAARFLNHAYPGVGTLIAIGGKSLTSLLEFGVNHYTANTRTNYVSMDKLADGSYKSSSVVLGNSNTQTMINNYGNLIKGFETELLDSGKEKETEIPLLYKTREHYFSAQYNFCQKDSTVNWDSLVAISIALDIYYDDTGKFLFWNNGEFEKRDSVIGGRVDYYNEIPSESEGGNIKESIMYHTEFTKDPNGFGAQANESYVPLEGSYKDFYFTPNRTFNYVIETINRSQNSDPYLKLYDNQGNLLAFNDDGGTVDSYGTYARNSKIVITLTGGQTYKLRTLCYGYKAGYYEFMIRKEATLLEANGSSLNANSTTVSYDAIWYKFTPSTTNYYSFYTVGSLDTYLELYSENFERYSFNDDGGTSLNAHIDFYLLAGKTYYLKAHTFGMGAGTFKVFANMQRIVQIHPLSKTSQYTYTFGKNESNFFRFTPTITREYTFYTYLYEGDPYLHLYDNTMTLLESNDDGGDGYNASLTYNLEAGKTYYIRIRNFGNTAGYGYLYCTYD